MNRLFTFGCSFTNYMWPTWADILAIEFDSYRNWGRIGAGNHFIFYSLLECINRNEITADDAMGCADNKIPTNLIDEFDFISKRHEINTMRQDFHPIPIEHYNYLIALNIPLTLNQHNYAVEWNDEVLTDVNLKFEQHKVIRF